MPYRSTRSGTSDLKRAFHVMGRAGDGWESMLHEMSRLIQQSSMRLYGLHLNLEAT